MLHVIVTATDNKVRFGPDDLTADLKTRGFKTLGDNHRLRAGMPDIGDGSRKQFPGFPPIGTVIILHASNRAVGFAESVIPPFGPVIHSIGRIGHHEDRWIFTDEGTHIRLRRGITTSQAVSTETQQIARTANGHRIGYDAGLWI